MSELRDNVVYVHLEKLTHMVLSYGIKMEDFVNSVDHVPEKILSIAPVNLENEIDINTGLNMVIGQKNVKKYLLNRQEKKRSWVDFEDQYNLEEVKPREVSELLYLGHAYSHLRSPFYYKLQNNYAFLTLPNGSLKIYYRYLNDFYTVFSYSLLQHATASFRDKRPIMSLRQRIAPLPEELVQELMPVFLNGAVFDFNTVQATNTQLKIPVLIAPDTIYEIKWYEPTRLVERSELVANLKYSFPKRKWDLEIIDQMAFDMQCL